MAAENAKRIVRDADRRRIACLEQRTCRRARLARVTVRYEAAPGAWIVGDVVDVGVGGLFVRATRPLAIGVTLRLELRMAEALRPLRALGCVAWQREHAGGDDEPTGMGVQFLAIEDEAREMIAGFVAIRESTMSGLGPAPEDRVPPSGRQSLPPVALSRGVNDSGVREIEHALPFGLTRRKSSAPPPSDAIRLDPRARARRNVQRALSIALVAALVALVPRDQISDAWCAPATKVLPTLAPHAVRTLASAVDTLVEPTPPPPEPAPVRAPIARRVHPLAPVRVAPF